MNEYRKTIQARLQVANKALEHDMPALAERIYKDVINDLLNMVDYLNSHIDAMKEIMRGE